MLQIRLRDGNLGNVGRGGDEFTNHWHRVITELLTPICNFDINLDAFE